jgi:hypothetical protein
VCNCLQVKARPSTLTAPSTGLDLLLSRETPARSTRSRCIENDESARWWMRGELAILKVTRPLRCTTTATVNCDAPTPLSQVDSRSPTSLSCTTTATVSCDYFQSTFSMHDHSEPTHELCIRISPLVHFTLSLASCSKLARCDLCDIVARRIASNHGGHSELNRSEIGGSRSLENREGVAAWHEPSRGDVVVLLRRATSTLPCRARRCVVALQRVVTPHLRRWISIKRAVVACRELSSQPCAAEQTSMQARGQTMPLNFEHISQPPHHQTLQLLLLLLPCPPHSHPRAVGGVRCEGGNELWVGCEQDNKPRVR